MTNRASRGRAFPSFEKLIQAVEAIAHNPNVERPALAGGLAMQFWGSPRLTEDVDVIALSCRLNGSPLSFGGERVVADNGVEVDVIVRDDEWSDLYDDANSHAEEVLDSPMPVVTPEHLVAIKMVAGRPKDGEDVRYLVLLEDFDLEACEGIVGEFLGPYAVKELRAIVEEAQWRATKEKKS